MKWTHPTCNTAPGRRKASDTTSGGKSLPSGIDHVTSFPYMTMTPSDGVVETSGGATTLALTRYKGGGLGAGPEPDERGQEGGHIEEFGDENDRGSADPVVRVEVDKYLGRGSVLGGDGVD